MAIVGGNVAVILAGRQWRNLGVPYWFGAASTVLGVAGLGGVVALAFLFRSQVPGIPERVAVDAIMAWDILAGLVLLARSTAGPRQTGVGAGRR